MGLWPSTSYRISEVSLKGVTRAHRCEEGLSDRFLNLIYLLVDMAVQGVSEVLVNCSVAASPLEHWHFHVEAATGPWPGWRGLGRRTRLSLEGLLRRIRSPIRRVQRPRRGEKRWHARLCYERTSSDTMSGAYVARKKVR